MNSKKLNAPLNQTQLNFHHTILKRPFPKILRTASILGHKRKSPGRLNKIKQPRLNTYNRLKRFMLYLERETGFESDKTKYFQQSKQTTILINTTR